MLKELGFRDSSGKINWVVVYICMLMTVNLLGEYGRSVVMKIFSYEFSHLAKSAVYTVCLLLALPKILPQLKLRHLIFPVLVALYYLLSYELNEANAFYLDLYASDFFIHTLPFFFIGCVWDSEALIKPLRVTAMLSIFFTVIYVVKLGGRIVGADEADHMLTAYSVLPFVCLMFYCALLQKNALNIIFTIGGVLFLLSLGTRGPIVCLLLFVVVCYSFVLKKKGILLSIVGGITLFFIYLRERTADILGILIERFSQYGLSSRVLYKLLDGKFLEDEARNHIHETLMNKLTNHDFVGYGFFSDRTFFPRTYSKGQYIDVYAHNIVIEFWVDFGRIVGTALFAVVLLLIARALLVARSSHDKVFIAIFTCCGLGHLMFSGSYLTSRYFFLLLGMVIFSHLSSQKSPLQKVQLLTSRT